MSQTSTTTPERPAIESIPARPPRRLTRRARWRSWMELPVQFWWKSALLVLIAGSIVAASEISGALKLRQLMRRSVKLPARIVELKGVTAANNRNFQVLRDDALPVKLLTRLPDGKEVTLEGFLPRGEGYLKVDGPVNILVDPADPSQWLEDVPPKPWGEIVAFPLFMMMPIALILLAIAWWRRRAVVDVWTNGRLVEGTIVGRKHAPTAPGSDICRYTVPSDRRVFQLLYPTRLGVPRENETMRLIVLDDRPDLAIAARAYEESS